MVGYKESPQTRALKSGIAKEKLRDANGHFIHQDPPAPIVSPNSGPTPEPENPLKSLLNLNSKSSIVNGKSDDLLDVHVGNPLEKIVTLLTEIKKQKAFSFTLKGSLGIAGVALTLGILGVFGGNQLLCSHGIQSQIGTVRILQYGESPKSTVPFIGSFIDKISPQPARKRVVLIRDDGTVLDLTGNAIVNGKSSIVNADNGASVVVTGDYNSCSQTLTVTDPSGIEPME